MTEATQTLAQLKKTSKLTRLAFHKNGPKSFRRGQGALLNALLENDGATQRETRACPRFRPWRAQGRRQEGRA